MNRKIVLAYSGGLDTSVILKWLEVEKGYDVIAVCVGVGQKEDYGAVKQKALSTGASKAYVVNVQAEFVEDYILPGLKAGAVYEDEYLLGTAFARPLIAKKLVEIAEAEGAEAIAHGCTGKGNDQVRFETSIMALNPNLKVIAPWREWSLKSREDCIDYAKAHHIPIPVTKKDIYSRDENLWHLSHEGGILEDTWNEHEASMYKLTVPADQAPETPEVISISFEAGTPIAINGTSLSPLELVLKLNDLAGKHGVGVIDIVENRLVGMKSRGVYETPGGTVLYAAHKALEKLVLDRSTLSFKKTLAHKYAELVYDGLWFSPLREAMDAFVDQTQSQVTGVVKMKLFKGSCSLVGSQSPYSLFDEAFVTFGEDEVYNQYHAEGFIQLFGLPLKIRALHQQEREAKMNKKGIAI